MVQVILLDVFTVVASLFVSPKSRSFRIGSLPFQRASAKQSRCLSSEIAAAPSSSQRYARERA